MSWNCSQWTWSVHAIYSASSIHTDEALLVVCLVRRPNQTPWDDEREVPRIGCCARLHARIYPSPLWKVKLNERPASQRRTGKQRIEPRWDLHNWCTFYHWLCDRPGRTMTTSLSIAVNILGQRQLQYYIRPIKTFAFDAIRKVSSFFWAQVDPHCSSHLRASIHQSPFTIRVHSPGFDQMHAGLLTGIWCLFE